MKRAQKKKLHKQFKVGDVVTWGIGRVAHRIIEMMDNGVVVDAASKGYPNLFVAFDGNNRSKSGRGPIFHSNFKPDTDIPREFWIKPDW